ncbi:MAG: ATP-grasp domain-containing protein [Anaerolineales bacterium]|nr:ATP-grasp domain-containing protein [Anaerolineales bacterium]
MFKRILVANRGEIAVRIIRTCREMGIYAISLYEKDDLGSLHVRLADECTQLPTAKGFLDIDAVIKIAKERQADAIHPGYGFLAERADFIRACEDAGITFIGPSAAVVEAMQGKLETLAKARAAGFTTVQSSPMTFGPNDVEALQAAATELTYPLVIKSCQGGRGQGEHLVTGPQYLEKSLRRSQFESQAVFGKQRVYLEKAILPAHQIGVQILADQFGNVIHLGEREGSIINSNQKILEESPAPCLSAEQREAIQETAVSLAKLFNYQNAGTVEFLVNGDGTFYFSEFKSRIQVEHSVAEARCGLDLVREQILIAAGEKLQWRQEDIRLNGWSMMVRINAEDPWRDFMPSPGKLERMRLPGGPDVRVDTYAYTGCRIPSQYVPLFAKLTVSAPNREICTQRMQRALEDFVVNGVPTNLPLLQRVLRAEEFLSGQYNTGFLTHPFHEVNKPIAHLQDLAVATAVYFMRRNQLFSPTTPDRFQSRWHQNSRRLPK